MSKENVYLKGKGSWFNHAIIMDEEYQKWHITLHLDQPSLEAFRALQVKTHLKKDDNGYFVRLSRPRKKIMRGKEVIFDAPKIFDKDGFEMSKEACYKIGNGSDITVKLEKYSYKPPGSKVQANAIRLESIRIDNLIPYEPKRDYTEEQSQAAEGLMDQPEPLF